jgi:cyclopropane fatty-acyl-phospholipid synthase-like methyltransferase
VTVWDEAYRGPVAPPWDIGRAQPEFVRLADAGLITGHVIDVGCGTGENALMLAAHGLEVVGMDVAPTAIERARRKARERGVANAAFEVWDALGLGALIERIGAFDAAIDSGVFHTFADEDRPAYVAGVAAAVRSGGRLFLMCMNEHEPDWGGPRRVTQAELRAAFTEERGWSVETIDAARFATNEDHPWLARMGSTGGSHAWLATVRRV